MNWYVAKIIFRIIGGAGQHQPQYDEQLRLINAADDRGAFAKACQLGITCQNDFLNNENDPVKWQFVDVAEINTLAGGLQDGAELYYQIQEPPNAELYEAWAHHKSMLLGLTTN